MFVISCKTSVGINHILGNILAILSLNWVFVYMIHHFEWLHNQSQSYNWKSMSWKLKWFQLPLRKSEHSYDDYAKDESFATQRQKLYFCTKYMKESYEISRNKQYNQNHIIITMERVRSITWFTMVLLIWSKFMLLMVRSSYILDLPNIVCCLFHIAWIDTKSWLIVFFPVILPWWRFQ